MRLSTIFVGHDHCPKYGQLGLSKLLGLSQLVVGSPRWAFWRCCTAVVVTLGIWRLEILLWRRVPLFLFQFLATSWEMDGKAEGRWLGPSPCDNERTIALRKTALRAYEGKSSELIPPGPRSRIGAVHPTCERAGKLQSVTFPVELLNCLGGQTAG